MSARSTPRGASAVTTEHEGPGSSPGFLLWRATHRWQRAIMRELRPLGLTHVQFVLLASLWWLSADGAGSPTQRELADHAGTDPMMTSQVLRGLESRGLVDRSSDPRDARSRRLSSTPAGTDLVARAMTVVESADRRFFARAQPDELLRTLRALALDADRDVGPRPAREARPRAPARAVGPPPRLKGCQPSSPRT